MYMCVFRKRKEAINACKSETKRGPRPSVKGVYVVVLAAACYPALSPIRTLCIGLLLPGEEGDVALYSPDGESSDCEEEEEDDDDNRDGDVALDHLGW